jgi:hypothetical protein
MFATPLVLIPAPGKHYADVDAMRTAWLNGEDFSIWAGKRGAYCSVRDLTELSRDTSSITITTLDCKLQFTVPVRDVWGHVSYKRGHKQ